MSSATIGLFPIGGEGGEGRFWHVGPHRAFILYKESGQYNKIVFSNKFVYRDVSRAVFAGMSPDRILFIFCRKKRPANGYAVFVVDYRDTKQAERFDFACDEIPFYSFRLSLDSSHIYLGSDNKIVRVYLARQCPPNSGCTVIQTPGAGRILDIVELARPDRSNFRLFVSCDAGRGECLSNSDGCFFAATNIVDTHEPKTCATMISNTRFIAISRDRRMCVYSLDKPETRESVGYKLVQGAEEICLSWDGSTNTVTVSYYAQDSVYFVKSKVTANSEGKLEFSQVQTASFLVAHEEANATAVCPSSGCGAYVTNSFYGIVNLNWE